MAVPQKVTAFRDFASQLAVQVVEQLCTEYEREVSQLWNDCVVYRHELERVAALLGSQLVRERQLHELLEKVADHQSSIASAVQMQAQHSPDSNALHQLVDHIVAQHQGILGNTLQGVSQAHSVTHAHVNQAKQLQDAIGSTESELARIMQLLQQPLVNEVLPQPTVAQIPGTGPPWTPGSGSMALPQPMPPQSVPGPSYPAGPYTSPMVAPSTVRQAASYQPPPVSVQPMAMVPPTTYMPPQSAMMGAPPRMR